MGILMQDLTMQNMGWSHEQMGDFTGKKSKQKHGKTMWGLLLNGIMLE